MDDDFSVIGLAGFADVAEGVVLYPLPFDAGGLEDGT